MVSLQKGAARLISCAKKIVVEPQRGGKMEGGDSVGEKKSTMKAVTRKKRHV